MAEYTLNYNLEKQQESDFVDINGINNNFDIIDEEIKKSHNNIGDLSLLTTTSNTDLVGAINEVNSNAGDKTSLLTTIKTSIVNAINEIVTNIGSLASLATTVKTSIVAAINELYSTKVAKGELIINVKDYGAVGDGATNDSSAITAALATGKKILIPEGVFYVGTTEFLIESTTAIIGSGRNKTIILCDDGNQSVFHFKNVDAFQIKDMTIRKSSYTSSSTTAIYSEGCGNSLIENVFSERVDTGINMVNGQANSIVNFDAWFFTGYGIFMSGGNNDHNIRDIFLNGQLQSGANGTGTGIRLIGKAEALNISDAEIILADLALSTDGVYSTGFRPAYSRFLNCFFDSCTHGVLLEKCVEIRFTQCWFSNRPNNGCEIIQSEDITFENTSFVNSAGSGCSVYSDAKRITFNNCSFISNGTGSVGIYHGIYIHPNVTDFIITNCKFYNGLGFAEQQAWGVLVDAGTSDRYIISNNLFSNNTAGSVYDGGTGTNKNVSNNF